MTTERPRVLVTDDDAISRQVIAMMLEPYFDAVEAPGGEEALAEYAKALDERKPFELVVLDVVMPGMHGPEVLKKLRAIEKTHPAVKKQAAVMMLTGETSTTTILDTQESGASIYILKPVDETLLLRELQRIGIIPDPDDQWE